MTTSDVELIAYHLGHLVVSASATAKSQEV